MNVQTEASPVPHPHAVRPRPAASGALLTALAETRCPQRREHMTRMANLATFPVTEVVVTETPYGTEIQLSGHGQMIMETVA